VSLRQHVVCKHSIAEIDGENTCINCGLVSSRVEVQRELGKTLDRIIEDKKSDLSKIWQCANEDDFLYGWHLGKVDDFCLNQYFVHYRKTPTSEDKDEIQGMILLHALDFRDRLTRHN